MQRLPTSGDWKEGVMTQQNLLTLLMDKIEKVSLERVKQDVVRFAPDSKILDIRSKQYFNDLLQKLIVT